MAFLYKTGDQMKNTFENEGEKFRGYMSAHPNAVVLLRHADGSCIVGSEGDTIDLQPEGCSVVDATQEPQP